MNLNEAKLQQRSKELDAREEYLDAKLKALEDAPVSLSVYESRVNSYERKLAGLTDLIKESEQEIKKLEQDYNNSYQVLRSLEVEIDRQQNIINSKMILKNKKVISNNNN